MKKIKRIYQALYSMLRFGLYLFAALAVLNVQRHDGYFQLNDEVSYFGIKAYFYAMIVYIISYLYIMRIPLLIEIILYIIYKIHQYKNKGG